VIDIDARRFVLRETPPSLSVEDLQFMTGADVLAPAPVIDLIVPEL
jgi:3-oxoadipate CoA-transferase beta subunit